MKRDFLQLTDFKIKELKELLSLASELKAKFKRREAFRPFKDHTLAMIFAKPSARTRISFETGFGRMGGNVVYLSPGDISIGKREAIKDIARVISRYNDMIVARLFQHDHLLELARFAEVPVVNGLTDYNHPCQILADVFTLQEYGIEPTGRKIVYMGDGNNVVHSWLNLACRMPLNFVCACPPGYTPDVQTVKKARDAGISKIDIVHDPMAAVKNAGVVYTDVWASMGQKHEAAERAKVFKNFQVNDELMAAAAKDAIFMHCLPAERGLETTDSVMESDASVVFDQAENRMHVQNAIMLKLMGKA